jgi:hypothetical protein
LDSQKASKHLLWILVIGAIASLNTANTAWFIGEVRDFSSHSMIKTWEDLNDILSCFLWLDITNEIDGAKVREEITSMKA